MSLQNITEESMVSIPTINMRSFTLGETKDFELQKLHSTCKQWGIFQLINHGVSSSLLDNLKYEIKEFYKLPLEERMRYKTKPNDYEGYGYKSVLTSDDIQTNIDWAHRFYMLTNPIHKRNSHLLPQLPSPLREILEAYLAELQKIAMTLLGFMGEALNLDDNEIKDMFEDGMQSLRITYYPPCPEPEKVMGFSPHSDGSGITILHQLNGVDGLQIKKDGIWLPVKFLPDAFVVNLGDILEILSNGIYHSIEHRVIVHSIKERISMGMFYNPKLEAEIGPSPKLIEEDIPPLFERISMEKYLQTFFSRKLTGKTNLDYIRIPTEKEIPSKLERGAIY